METQKERTFIWECPYAANLLKEVRSVADASFSGKMNVTPFPKLWPPVHGMENVPVKEKIARVATMRKNKKTLIRKQMEKLKKDEVQGLKKLQLTMRFMSGALDIGDDQDDNEEEDDELSGISISSEDEEVGKILG